jgi:hypothetical protein
LKQCILVPTKMRLWQWLCCFHSPSFPHELHPCAVHPQRQPCRLASAFADGSPCCGTAPSNLLNFNTLSTHSML